MKNMEHVHAEVNLQGNANNLMSHAQNKAIDTYHLSSKGTERKEWRDAPCADVSTGWTNPRNALHNSSHAFFSWKLITCHHMGLQLYQFHRGQQPPWCSHFFDPWDSRTASGQGGPPVLQINTVGFSETAHDPPRLPCLGYNFETSGGQGPAPTEGPWKMIKEPVGYPTRPGTKQKHARTSLSYHVGVPGPSNLSYVGSIKVWWVVNCI